MTALRLSLSNLLRNINNKLTIQSNITPSTCSLSHPISVTGENRLQWLTPLPLCVPSRHYGRKITPNPPKITFFEYSGDLRTLPKLNTDEILYPYLDSQEELESDEVLKKLVSLEFASQKEKRIHMEQMVQNRIIELFGADSELEQRIARFTLMIRQRIPYCIANRSDKLKKIWLLKAIFHRRRLLAHLRDIDYERFEWLLRELRIRYVVPQDRQADKGWMHNQREATKAAVKEQKRAKLQELKEKLAAEKNSFLEHKAKVLAEIDKDLKEFGLSRDFLNEVQKRDVEEPKEPTWGERAKQGMVEKAKV